MKEKIKKILNKLDEHKIIIGRIYDFLLILIIFICIHKGIITLNMIKNTIIILLIYTGYNLFWELVLNSVLMIFPANNISRNIWKKKYGEVEGNKRYDEYIKEKYKFLEYHKELGLKFLFIKNFWYYLSIISNPFWLIGQIVGIISIKIKIQMQRYLSYKVYEWIEKNIFPWLLIIFRDPILRIFYIYYNLIYKIKKTPFIEYFLRRIEGYLIILFFLFFGLGWIKRILLLILIYIYLAPIIDKYIIDLEKKFVNPDTHDIFAVMRYKVSFICMFLRLLNVLYRATSYTYNEGWELAGKLYIYWYYDNFNKVIKNGYYFIDYDAYCYFRDYTTFFPVNFIYWVRFNLKKDLDLILISREEFEKEYQMIKEELKEKILLLWNIAEYLNLKVEKNVENMIFYEDIMIPGTNKLLCPRIIFKWPDIFHYKEDDENKKFFSLIKIPISIEEEKKEKEILEKKKKEIQKLLKEKGENYIKNLPFYYENLLKFRLKMWDSNYGKRNLIEDTLNLFLNNKIKEINEKFNNDIENDERKNILIEEIIKYVQITEKIFYEWLKEWREEWEKEWKEGKRSYIWKD